MAGRRPPSHEQQRARPLISDDRPAIVVVDPAGDGTGTVTELRARYAVDYVVEIHGDTAAAAARLRAQAGAGQPVALVLADRRSDGAVLLDTVRSLHPHARRGLLLEWNESRTHREEVAAAFARRAAECFVTKPLGPGDERFHRSITELLDEWTRAHGTALPFVRVIGRERTARVVEILDVLQRHDFPSRFDHVDSDAARAVLATVDEPDPPLPVVTLHDGRTLVDPSNLELANALGARTRAGVGVYDLVVVGGGPAGLSAAVYAQSEGLRTALVEPTAMGGQAGTSSMIRNYLGFPRGVSGAELAARAFEQAILFGTEMIYGSAAVGLRADGDRRVVALSDGSAVPGQAVVIATGVSYRTLGVASLEAFSGRGVHYGAAMSEAPALTGRDVYVVGGGNSAGQAAIHLSRYARAVTVLVRGDSLAASMSDYLVTEIAATENVEVRYAAEVVGGAGDGRLERLQLRDGRTGETAWRPADALFVLIGAAPFTQWLPADIARDEWGYVTTGPSPEHPDRLPFESSMAGVFAVGDVRRDSVKRVASAVGEGAVCVRMVHEHLG